MYGVMFVVAILCLILALAIWSAVEFSMPAPDWLEEEEYYKERYRWYK